MGTEGGKMLLSALKENTSVVYIEVAGNNISNDIVK